jgi:DNA-binding LacI/PurR family transcriptional regulator
VIEELGYHPSSLARSLKTRRTTTIAALVSDISNPFFTAVVRGIEDGLHERDHQMILCNTDEDGEKEDRYLRAMLAKRVDGLLIAPVGHKDSFLRVISQHTPTLCIDRAAPDLELPVVGVDNQGAARDAVAHLIQHGHSRIGAVGGLRRVSTSRARLEGYEAALREAGIQVDRGLIREGGSKVEGGAAATRELLALSDPPTAIFASNNLMTLGVLKALDADGMRCPADVALVGFDDHDWAEQFTPPLTVVRQPTYELGSLAAGALMQLVAGGSIDPIAPLRAELVVRGSCGAHP